MSGGTARWVPTDTLTGVSARGYFIAFEGGDGVGKSTQARALAPWLQEVTGREVVLTREPGGTELGRTLRAAVLHGEDVDPRTEALLYAADRAHHVHALIRPALARGAVVLTDRYMDSSIAYQGSGRALDAGEVERLSLWATGGLLPDLTVLLDLDPAAARERRTGVPDRLEREGEEFFTRIRSAFLDLARRAPERYLVVDASQDREAVQEQVRAGVVAQLDRAGVRA